MAQGDGMHWGLVKSRGCRVFKQSVQYSSVMLNSQRNIC